MEGGSAYWRNVDIEDRKLEVVERESLEIESVIEVGWKHPALTVAGY